MLQPHRLGHRGQCGRQDLQGKFQQSEPNQVANEAETQSEGHQLNSPSGVVRPDRQGRRCQGCVLHGANQAAGQDSDRVFNQRR